MSEVWTRFSNLGNATLLILHSPVLFFVDLVKWNFSKFVITCIITQIYDFIIEEVFCLVNLPAENAVAAYVSVSPYLRDPVNKSNLAAFARIWFEKKIMPVK